LPSHARAISASGVIAGDAAITSIHAVSWDRGQLRDLGVLPPAPNEDVSQSYARAINDSGTIVGASGGFEAGPNDGAGRAALWRNGAIYLLPKWVRAA
jgi:uncharacterized membrane protein